jgi:cytochrome c
MTPPSFRRGGAFTRAAFAVAIMARAVADVHPVQAAGDAGRGEMLYRDCQACHSVGENGVGPMHRGVFGRGAGMVEGYHYSPALKNAKIVWTEENLDKWLTDPQGLVPGTKMYYEVADPRDRADLIAFLKERAR